MTQDERDDMERADKIRAALKQCVKALHEQQVAHIQIGAVLQAAENRDQFSWISDVLSPTWQKNDKAIKAAEEALEA